MIRVNLKKFILYFLVPAFLILFFQNCSRSVGFEEGKEEIGTLHGNGSGHEGKLPVPIDYVTDVLFQAHYQEHINFVENLSANSGDVTGVDYYCRSVASSNSEGVDFLITKPMDTLPAASETYDFSSSASPSGIQLTRGSAATAWDSSGALVTFLNNQPRQAVQDSSGNVGLLLENSSTNILRHSDNFLDPLWSRVRANIQQSSTQWSPTLSSNAFTLSEGTFANFHYLEQSVNLLRSRDYSFSVYAKELSPGRGLSVRFYDLAGRNFRCSYSFSDQTVSKNPTSNPFQCLAESYPNGWVRLSVIANSGVDPAGPSRVKIELYNPTIGSGSYPGVSHPGVLIWGSQLEAQASPTSYIQTGAAPVTRAADQLTLRSTRRVLNEASLELDYKLQGSLERFELQLPVSNAVDTLVTVESQSVQASVDGQNEQKIFSNLQSDQKLALKVGNGEVSVFARGTHVATLPTGQPEMGVIGLNPLTGGVLLKSLELNYKPPITELLSLLSLESPDTSAPYGVVVLGRNEVAGPKRVQSVAFPLQRDQGQRAWFGVDHDLAFTELASGLQSIDIFGSLSDGTILQLQAQCVEGPDQ